jgi:hypothetical protein
MREALAEKLGKKLCESADAFILYALLILS